MRVQLNASTTLCCNVVTFVATFTGNNTKQSFANNLYNKNNFVQSHTAFQ